MILSQNFSHSRVLHCFLQSLIFIVESLDIEGLLSNQFFHSGILFLLLKWNTYFWRGLLKNTGVCCWLWGFKSTPFLWLVDCDLATPFGLNSSYSAMWHKLIFSFSVMESWVFILVLISVNYLTRSLSSIF